MAYSTQSFRNRKHRLANPTPTEAALAAALDAHGIRYQRERPLYGRFFADFYFPNECVALEVDGKDHRGAVKRAADERRDAYLAERGVLTVRVTSTEITENVEEVVAQLAATLRSREGEAAPRPSIG